MDNMEIPLWTLIWVGTLASAICIALGIAVQTLKQFYIGFDVMYNPRTYKTVLANTLYVISVWCWCGIIMFPIILLSPLGVLGVILGFIVGLALIIGLGLGVEIAGFLVYSMLCMWRMGDEFDFKLERHMKFLEEHESLL
jgi:hypothetical protein